MAVTREGQVEVTEQSTGTEGPADDATAQGTLEESHGDEMAEEPNETDGMEAPNTTLSPEADEEMGDESPDPPDGDDEEIDDMEVPGEWDEIEATAAPRTARQAEGAQEGVEQDAEAQVPEASLEASESSAEGMDTADSGYEVAASTDGVLESEQNGVTNGAAVSGHEQAVLAMPTLEEALDQPQKGNGVLKVITDSLTGMTSVVGGIFKRGAEEEPVGLAAELDVEEEERKEFNEREAEWPTSKIEDVTSIREFFGLSHVADGDRLVRADGTRVVIFESAGKEISRANIQGFAGALNSIQCPVQFLIRQHSPRLNGFRLKMREERAARLSERLVAAAEDLDGLLAELEDRPGLMDRRYYIVCDEENMDEVTAAVSRLNLKAGFLAKRALDIFLLSATFGQSPADLPEQERIHYRELPSAIKSDNGIYRRTFYLKKFPRTITVGFLQSLLTIGIPMDLSIHLMPISSEHAISMLQSQLTSMQAAANSQLKRTGQMGSKEQIALEDILRLRDACMRGTERLFYTNFAITVTGTSEEELNNHITSIDSMFKAVVAEIDELTFNQRKALRTTMPFGENATKRWVMLDTSTVALMFPFSPQDMDTRTGTLVGLDARARSLITFDEFNSRSAQNMNKAILATSGAGKSYLTKLDIVRQITRDVRVYVIDPEGEYVDTCIAAGGRVLTPGVPGQGMNPFVVTETGADLMERIDNLCNLLQVMIGQRLDATMYGGLNKAMVDYYGKATIDGQGNWTGLFNHIHKNEPAIAAMLTPFYDGSKQYLLSDEGTDILRDEAMMTVFNLRLIDSELRAAAGMVCTETVWTMAARDPRPRKLIVDEVWSILQDPNGAAFLMNTAKRARKHILGLTSITQDVQDLLAVNSNEGVRGNSGRALIQNASFKILLRQDPASIGMIRETFNLSHEVAAELPSYPTGRGLLVTPEGNFPMHIEGSSIEAEIIEWKAGAH